MKKLMAVCAVSLALAVVACGDRGRGAAEAAITTLTSSYAAVKADAAKYLPEETQAIDQAVSTVQQSFSQGDYMKALNEAQGVTSKVEELGAALSAKKAEITKAWEGLNAGLPGALQAIETRVSELSNARKLPAGVQKESIEAAKTGLAAASSTWNRAVESFKRADLTDALSKAQTVKTKAAEIMASLGMPVPDSLK